MLYLCLQNFVSGLCYSYDLSVLASGAFDGCLVSSSNIATIWYWKLAFYKLCLLYYREELARFGHESHMVVP
jgi:hypothetical protein